MSTDELSFTPSARPGLPDLAEGDLKLAFANLLNYFTNYDGRGADNDEEFLRQSSKTSLALSMMNADIVAVCELENAGATAADDLVEKLNSRFSGGERVYSAATSDQGISMVGDDVIRVDVLFDTLKYEVLSSAMLTDDLVSQALLDESPSGTIFNGKSRVPLAVTFQDIDTDKEFTVVVTHFKSKGDFSGDASGADEDQGNGAAHYNPTRELSTLAVKEWLESRPTGFSTNKVIVVGDMNAYSSEGPIEAWYSTQFGQYYDALNKQAAEPWLYSYLFDGQFGSLDHAFVPVNSIEEMSIEGAAIWNINSDELDIHDYNTDYGRNKDIFNADEPYRFSDHDPILLSIKFEPTLTSTSSLPPSGNGNGDPHFTTFSGISFDYHGECDLVMLSSPSFASGSGLSVHIRTTRMDGKLISYSYISGAAVGIGNDIFEVQQDGTLFVNGKRHMNNDASLPTEFATYPFTKNMIGKKKKINQYVLNLTDSNIGGGQDESKHLDTMTITIHANPRTHMLFVKIDGDIHDGIGLLGNPLAGNRLLGRDGVTDMSKDCNKYGEEWQVRDTERKLFQEQRSPQYPDACIYHVSNDGLSKKTHNLRRRLLADGKDDNGKVTREEANAVCEDFVGVNKDNCVYDVMVMGDLAVAEDPSYGI